jgi:hypothetical protein
LDPLDVFRAAEARDEPLYFDTDDHLTPQGHRLLADVLATRLAALLKASR